jgi:cytochrome c553
MKKTILLLMGVVPALVLPQSVLAGDSAAGKAGAQGCMACHNAVMNNLADKGEAYLSTQMKMILSGERTHPPGLSDLSDQDVNDIAAFMNGTQ